MNVQLSNKQILFNTFEDSFLLQMSNSAQSKLLLLALLRKTYLYTCKNIATKPNLDEFLRELFEQYGTHWKLWQTMLIKRWQLTGFYPPIPFISTVTIFFVYFQFFFVCRSCILTYWLINLFFYYCCVLMLTVNLSSLKRKLSGAI